VKPNNQEEHLVGWIRQSRNPPNKTSRAFDFLRGGLLNLKQWVGFIWWITALPNV
jgi:hypothetical protein